MTDKANQAKSPKNKPIYAREDLEKQIEIRTAQLLETNQRLQREINERKRAEQITRTLFRISNAVNTSKDLNELYASIHKALGEIIDLTNFYIALYYRQTRKITFPYFKDTYDSHLEYSEFFKESNSLTGEVILAEAPVFLNEADLHQRAAEKKIIGTVPRIWIGVPLKIKNEVIGVMAVQSYDDPDHFDHFDLDILTSVSDQIALAIERKRSEQALKESEEKYRGILESIEDGYYEVDLAGNFILVNEAMCRILGCPENELLGLNNRAYMDDDTAKRIYRTFNSVYQTGQPAKALDWEVTGKDGKLRYAETVVSLVRDNEGQPTGFRGIARDITERKTAEKKRRQLEKRLQQSQRLEALGTLAGGIAHDFNNLLMGIQGRAALMLAETDTSNHHYQQLKHIETYVHSASALTSRLLGFARGGKYEVRPENLNTLIEKSIQMFGRTKKEITITSKLLPTLKPVEVDAGQIEQVLLNLFVNAGQAMSNGGRIDIITANLCLDRKQAQFYGVPEGDYVRLTVADTGHGMDTKTLARIFDPFFTTKALGRGTGLGLAMVYGIVKNHMGAIQVESEPGRGATFTIFLPASKKTVSNEAALPNGIQRGTETILLVDDEEMIIDVGKDILQSLGYTVLTADSGRNALKRYRENSQIDLVIVDMIMPSMGGAELYEKLKAINPKVKVLLSSGYSIDHHAHKIMAGDAMGLFRNLSASPSFPPKSDQPSKAGKNLPQTAVRRSLQGCRQTGTTGYTTDKNEFADRFFQAGLIIYQPPV